MKKARTYKLILQAMTTVFLLISTTTAIQIENIEGPTDYHSKDQQTNSIIKNGIVFCYLGVFIPPADTVPLRTDIEIQSLDGTIQRYIPAGMIFSGLKLIPFLPCDKTYIITAEWQGQKITEPIHSFNQFGIERVFLIFQVDGP